MPRFKELSVKSLIQQAKTDPELWAYCDDDMIRGQGRKLPRTYLVAIMTTLRPEFMKQLLNDCRDTRLNENIKQDRLQVLPEFRKLICETKY